MQKLHLYCVILNLVRITISRQHNHVVLLKCFNRVNRSQIMGTLMISIIFALFVDEGIKYLRQIRREMYDL